MNDGILVVLLNLHQHVGPGAAPVVVLQGWHGNQHLVEIYTSTPVGDAKRQLRNPDINEGLVVGSSLLHLFNVIYPQSVLPLCPFRERSCGEKIAMNTFITQTHTHQ